jgi:hypothetical protein
MGQNFFCVFKSFGHFGVGTFQGSGQGVIAPFPFFVHVGQSLVFRRQNHFGFVCEIYLNDFVGKPE